MKDLKEELKQVNAVPPYPKVRNTPAGWPSLDAMGDAIWYNRAVRWERMHGKPVLPLDQEEKENG